MTVPGVQHRTFAQALEEFEEAWANPRYTAIELPAVDVNRVLSERYSMDPVVQMTRDHLWDMEVRKAWDPLTYIPYVVSEASSWGASDLPDGSRRHLRSSIQKAWGDETRGRVLEEVFADPAQQRVLFLGRTHMEAEDGGELTNDPYQPLFHVEHAVGGTQETPTNLWRIVMVTDGPDDRLRAPFDAMVRAGWVPGFVEIYLEHDLHVTLRRR